jgi:prepilin-type N-terminal cleavage/methylation domain-containing protein
MCRQVRTRRGFSLIEIVIVVMVLGILASIAALKLLGTSLHAVDNGVRQSLGVIRTAIDSYSAEHDGVLPGTDGAEATFKNDMVGYIRGNEFPACPIGVAKNSSIRMMSGTGSVAASIGGTAATHSWVYKYQTGDFHVNSTAVSADGVTTYDQF